MSLEYRSLEVGPIETNCYIVWDTDTLAAAIIDPGYDQELIGSQVESLGLKVEWVLMTHGHFDHSFLAGAIAGKYGAKIGMQALDIMQVTESLDFGAQFYDIALFVPFTPTDLLNDGDVIALGTSTLKVLHTPGHSQGGLCFVTEIGVFCGDTIFAGSVGRTDFPGGSHDQLMSSIKTKILTLDDSTPLYPGHGPVTSVGEERRENWYLK